MIWGNLLHVGMNMWEDWRPENHPHPGRLFDPNLRCDDVLFAELTQAMADAGMNLVVLDLADAVRYESHPEIAVNGAWTTERLRRELARLRGLGLEPIPKLNFGTAHDAWLKDYSRMVSTPRYYEICADLIAEVSALFDTPRLFHLGMDEENLDVQKDYEHVVIRQHDLWWRDLYFLIEQVEKAGSRPWIWSDYAWWHPEQFYAKMPRSVVQSNWYYEADFEVPEGETRPRKLGWKHGHVAYLDLQDHGYDQVPTGSNWSTPDNFARTVAFCREHVAPEHLLGFLQTPWKATLPENRDHHLAAIAQVKRAKEGIEP